MGCNHWSAQIQYYYNFCWCQWKRQLNILNMCNFTFRACATNARINDLDLGSKLISGCCLCWWTNVMCSANARSESVSGVSNKRNIRSKRDNKAYPQIRKKAYMIMTWKHVTIEVCAIWKHNRLQTRRTMTVEVILTSIIRKFYSFFLFK